MSSDAKRIGREHALLQELRRQRLRLVPVPNHVLVGFSGGSDSLALLILLKSLAGHTGFRVSAVHVNHGIRDGSDVDADLAAHVCAVLDIPLATRRIDQQRLANHQGVGLEEAMRRERYLAFSAVQTELEADVLALAHHQRDQAETVLLHLVRGAGLHGASGMRPFTEITVPWWDDDPGIEQSTLPIWRPLLDTPIEQVHATSAASGLPISEDPSNLDESFRRNAIRHSVLPLLERVAPGATANIARFGHNAAVDDDALEIATQRSLEPLVTAGAIDRVGLLSLPRAIQSRLLRRWIAEQGPRGLEVSRERVDAVLAVVSTPGPRRVVELGLGTHVEVTRDEIRLVAQPLT